MNRPCYLCVRECALDPKITYSVPLICSDCYRMYIPVQEKRIGYYFANYVTPITDSEPSGDWL